MIGLSHHNAGVEVREKLAVPEAEWEAVAAAIVESSDGAVAEAAVLSTCNRFEARSRVGGDSLTRSKRAVK